MEAPAQIEPGTVVSGRYRVVSWLGEGAMGAVYRVEDVTSRKPFALKVLHESMSSMKEAVARFEREAIAAGKIAHRNVASATDFGRMPDGSFFMVLEFVAGRSLRSELDDGPLEPRRGIRIMQGVVAGVARCAREGNRAPRSQAGKHHASSIRTGPWFRQRCRFRDRQSVRHQLSRTRKRRKNADQSGDGHGTPDYMSPSRRSAALSMRAPDLYSLGVVLYEFDGSAPFRGGAAALRQQVMDQPKPLPRKSSKTATRCWRTCCCKLSRKA
jgi:serine/threonine-protein kinase